MPCRCDHMEPTARENAGREACKLLVYCAESVMLGFSLPQWIREGAKNVYGPDKDERIDEAVSRLCNLCRFLDEEKHKPLADMLMYDGRNPKARKLADWWQKHKAADVKAGR